MIPLAKIMLLASAVILGISLAIFFMLLAFFEKLKQLMYVNQSGNMEELMGDENIKNIMDMFESEEDTTKNNSIKPSRE